MVVNMVKEESAAPEMITSARGLISIR